MESWDKTHEKKPKLSTLRAIKSGYLTKRGAIVKSWKKRYFILTEHHLLHYFENHKDENGFKGVIFIKDASISTHPSLHGGHNVIEIQPITARHPGWTKDNREIFCLAASTKEEMEDWANIIRHHTKVHGYTGTITAQSRPSPLQVPPTGLAPPAPLTTPLPPPALRPPPQGMMAPLPPPILDQLPELPPDDTMYNPNTNENYSDVQYDYQQHQYDYNQQHYGEYAQHSDQYNNGE